MPTITIPVEEDQLEYLREAAEKLGISVEELARLGIDEYVSRRLGFERAADYVLQKNAELYRRLAQ
jgi:antitoxin FitA